MKRRLKIIQSIMNTFIKMDSLFQIVKLKWQKIFVKYVIKMMNNNMFKQLVAIKYAYNVLINQYKLIILNTVKYVEERIGMKKQNKLSHMIVKNYKIKYLKTYRINLHKLEKSINMKIVKQMKKILLYLYYLKMSIKCNMKT